MKVLLVVVAVFLLGFLHIAESALTENTCDRITQHGYPCENHTVITSDGYLLTVFRIPNSPRVNIENQNSSKPAVLMMHCLLCSSDIWVLNGPDNGLSFMLADAGYDVWIGNARGNVYSERHESLSPWSPAFWDFSIDQIAQYDVPAKIDYILATTKQTAIHYVGYSQGTTVFMMLMSKQPNYNQKIKTSHLLGPGVFLCHMKSPLAALMAHVVGRPFFASLDIMSSQTLDVLIRTMSPPICKQPVFESLCIMAMDFLTGWGSPHLNRTLLGDLLKTTPADGSNRQIIQFFQFTASCEFKAYDFGLQGNMLEYGEAQPPRYNLDNVKPQTPINVYYSDNDYFVSLEDVQHLSMIMGDRLELHRVKYPKFNHFDFAVAENVKVAINSCVVAKVEKYEGRPFNESLCDNYNKKSF